MTINIQKNFIFHLMKSQPKSKLILDCIDYLFVFKSLKPASNKGSRKYNIESILRAFLVQQLEGIPSRAPLSIFKNHLNS